ncbi:hypothetical protein [Nocardia sp. NPDC003963]
MSVNIELALTIREMKNEGERAAMARLLTDILESLDLAQQVSVTLGENGPDLFVRAHSAYPVVSSGYRWLDDFEADLTRQATALVSHAQIDFTWADTDTELEGIDDGW